MTSASRASIPASADLGLLSPSWAGAPIAAETGDAAIVRAMLDAWVALAAAGLEVGVVPEAAAHLIRRVTDTVEVDIADVATRARTGGNPVIPLLADVRKAVGERTSRYLHLGATSQDILDSALMLVAKRGIRLIIDDLDAAVAALADLADTHRATPMAARTLTQHSLPTTFGRKAAGWLVLVADARGFLTAVASALPAQLGGAAGTLASFHELAPGRELEIVDRFAAHLGLASPPVPWHTMRTPVLRLADALAGAAAQLGKVSADVSLLARTEIGELHEATGGGSSAMPQKQNPARSVLINAAARRAPGLAAELQRSASAVDERPDGAWHAEWQTLRELLRATGGAAHLAADLLTGLQVDTQRMRQNLAITGPLIVSERVSLVLGPVIGTGVVKQLVAESAQHPASLFDRLKHVVPDWNDERLHALLDPMNYLGVNDELIDRALAHAKSVTPAPYMDADAAMKGNG